MNTPDPIARITQHFNDSIEAKQQSLDILAPAIAAAAAYCLGKDTLCIVSAGCDGTEIGTRQVAAVATTSTVATDRYEATGAATVAAASADALHEHTGRKITCRRDATRIEYRYCSAHACGRTIATDRYQAAGVATVAAATANALREDTVREIAERIECAVVADDDVATRAAACTLTTD